MMKKFLFLMAATAILSCAGPDPLTLLVGTYTDGFYAYSFDPMSGKVVSEGHEPEAPGAFAKAHVNKPSFLAVDGDRIYAIGEVESTPSVSAWRMVGQEFDSLGSQPTCIPERRGSPCHVSTDGRFLAVSNYRGGSLALYRLLEGGRIGPLDSLVISGIGGPDEKRQNVPHVHCAIFSPDGKYLFFSEFSSDSIGSLEVDKTGMKNYRCAAKLDPDYGPRHLLFSADGKHLYVIGELSGTVTVLDYDNGMLTSRQVVMADQVGARGAADIHFSPDGKFLYASLRLKNDGIAVFSVDADGLLHFAGYDKTGTHPRNFNISPDGRFVLVACMHDNVIEIYSRNEKTGRLTDTGRRIPVEKPSYVGWFLP